MTRICIIAGNYDEAFTFAAGQSWNRQQWFYPRDEQDLANYSNFHVLVIGTAGQNVPLSWFNKFYDLAVRRGRIDREDNLRTH